MRDDGGMRNRVVAAVAGLLIVTGAALVVTATLGDTEFGWVAYAPERGSFVPGSLVLLTRQQAVGWGAVWLGTLLVAALVGNRIAGRRRPHA